MTFFVRFLPPFAFAALTAGAVVCAPALAQQSFGQQPAARQDSAAVRQTVEEFLKLQTSGMQGKAEVQVGQIDGRLSLPACAAPQAFLPQGSRAWGKTTVGVRCSAPSTWTIYVAAVVRVNGTYIAAAVPLAQGQTVGTTDIVALQGDLTTLPPGVLTDPAQASGRTVTLSLAAGAPLRQEALRSKQAVQQGQTVRLVTSGPGFSVSTEGRAMTNAGEGQMAQVKAPTGQVVSGIARIGGVVEVAY